MANERSVWIDRVRTFEQEAQQVLSTINATRQKNVFIGHGGSPDWRDLKDFLQDDLGVSVTHFNRESTAGVSTAERLKELLNQSAFAFIVMSAENQHSDTTFHARDNVIHEAGLFQGHLGFSRSIVLLEEGCEEFSNIHGLGQIRYPKGDIRAKSDEIMMVLRREQMIKLLVG